MKKLLIAIATLGFPLIPVVGASADSPSTNIATSQNQAASVAANKNNSSSSSNAAYYNQNVNYEAVSLVKYDASTTAFTTSAQNNQNSASLLANEMNNSQSLFSMPALYSQYSY